MLATVGEVLVPNWAPMVLPESSISRFLLVLPVTFPVWLVSVRTGDASGVPFMEGVDAPSILQDSGRHHLAHRGCCLTQIPSLIRLCVTHVTCWGVSLSPPPCRC